MTTITVNFKTDNPYGGTDYVYVRINGHNLSINYDNLKDENDIEKHLDINKLQNESLQEQLKQVVKFILNHVFSVNDYELYFRRYIQNFESIVANIITCYKNIDDLEFIYLEITKNDFICKTIDLPVAIPREVFFALDD